MNAIRVALLGPNGRWRPSMDRYTDQLAAGPHPPELDVTAPYAADRRELPPRGRGADWRLRWLRYPLAARRLDADVFHVTDHSYGHLAAVLPPERTIVTCHDLMPIRATAQDLGFALPRRALVQYRASVQLMRRARHLVAVSEATRDDLTRLLGVARDRVTVVPNGVGPVFRRLDDEQRATTRARLGLADGQVALVHVGASPYKDQPTVVAVLAAVRATGHDAVLLQVGEPWEPTAQQAVRDQRMTAHVRPLGPVDDEELVAVYNAADVLVFPSLWEGYGWPPAEAMACGLPVVVSDTPALLEVVGDAGLSAPVRDVDAFIRQVVALLADRTTWQRHSAAGLERARTMRWAGTVAAYDALYLRVAG